jgi:hypothetical protein
MSGLFTKHKEAVVSLVVWAIVATGCWLYFNMARKPEKSPGMPPSAPAPASPARQATPASPVTPASPATTDLDLTSYFAAFEQLADRLSEQQEFVKGLKGKKVRWRGYVSYVRNSDVSLSKIALAITPTAGDENRTAVVYFGEDMRGRLFALREKEFVEITGTFDSESWDTPYIQGQTLQPVPSGAATPPALTRAAR